MRLDSIRLIGFKSFVDPTTLAFPSNLTAVVGPNGCGKSNIIDAIRWVMGESSAKQLRGQSLDDVIFNGCSTRKSLGQAAIELNFDNSDASLGGQYSSYAQLSIRREITRDGQSTYFLNGTRCRRRDIRDIFLGTGLGPRSYAIIEQGMISRLIEAKPDELRAYIEEAAGISKYKERRRETENRLTHTEENLNRLNDVREELEKQGRHLQRQAKAAEDYKRYKQEERQCKAQLHALRYRDLHKQIAVDTAAIVDIQAHLDTLQQEQAALTQARNESLAQQEQSRAAYEGLQNRYYALGTELSRLEEKVQHQRNAFYNNKSLKIKRYKPSYKRLLRNSKTNLTLLKPNKSTPSKSRSLHSCVKYVASGMGYLSREICTQFPTSACCANASTTLSAAATAPGTTACTPDSRTNHTRNLNCARK
ncbi:chromosome segregation SMC family protein [Rickettsiella massiliensis]|uniref:chromosome segregation SMC family protein n=1 Tax=Rickettsiella massiliensis TaxID=676517 RepID=UPI00029AE8A0|nr:AAA family ATPase [Rickettsiella massiliensis]